MTRPLSSIAADVNSRATGMRNYVNRMERLYLEGFLSQSDLHRVYAGAYISFYSDLEQFIERAFMGLLMNRLRSDDLTVRPLVDIKSNTVAHAVIRGDRKFVDWLPYETFTMQRAKAFFSGGRPFADLGKTERKALERANVMRNAIAHSSSQAKRRFLKVFTDGKPLPPDQLKPAGYLRGQHARNQSRLDYMFGEAVNVMRVLCR
jgi:hypothetical protein